MLGTPEPRSKLVLSFVGSLEIMSTHFFCGASVSGGELDKPQRLSQIGHR